MSQDPVAYFRDNHAIYSGLAGKIRPLLEEILHQGKIKSHFVESRAKTVESFSEKIKRPTKTYTDPIAEITDLVGARIVVYYADDLEVVGKVLSGEFEICETETSHLPENYSADKFGYLSAHYICKLASKRSDLIEWKAFASLKFEIQVRTVLQHSWAAVSHALQYKREGDVPNSLRRRLFRLAGLFEIADQEFMQIRDVSVEQRKLSTEAVAAGRLDVLIDSAAILAFIRDWERMPMVVAYARERGARVSDILNEQSDYVAALVEQCERLNIKTLEQLKAVLNYDHKPFFDKMITKGWGMSKMFLLYLLVIGGRGEDFTVNQLTEGGGWSADIAGRVLRAAKKSADKP